jgi:16S rRNA (cytosine967-C5)-methyltransferase
MTPAARVQAAIELLEAIEAGDRPADLVFRAYVRSRRYIGAKDRRAVADLVFAAVRARIRLDWLLARHKAEPSPRLRALALVALERGEGAGGVARLCGDGRFAPAPLDEREGALLAALEAGRAADGAAMPLAVRANFPAWLEPSLTRRFGAELEAEMAALDAEALLDLRVNERRAERDTVLAALRSFGLDAAATPLSPLGIRLAGRPQVTRHPAWGQGLIEVQDEGAQLVALLVGAEKAECVIDYCAGAGGKTLALAARLAPGARLVACDTDGARLARMAPRLARARVEGVETRVVAEADDPWVAANAGSAERVLLDMPCSATGTWRRTPDARHRLTPARLAEHLARQRSILAHAAPLVRTGGRLVYATCSLLPEENEDQVEAFLARERAFSPLDIGAVWRETIGGEPPGEGPALRLAPRRHGVDGFFVAVLERRAG